MPPTTHQRLSLVAKVAEGTTPEIVEPEGSRSTFFWFFNYSSHPGVRPLRDDRLEHVEDGLGQRDVDDLPAPQRVGVARAKGHDGPESGVQTRQIIA